MPLPPPETQEFSEQLALLQNETRQELEQSQQQLQEIQLLIGQTNNEVERLMQRELALANRVRDMEMNLESYSRTDIRALYNSNHEVHLQLFMMRGQAEQLEARQQNIKEYQDKLRTILELLHLLDDVNASRATALLDTSGATEQKKGPAGLGQYSPVTIVEGQEEERLRLARELQDGPTQALTNILLHLEVCRQVLRHDVDSAQREMDTLKTMLIDTLRGARRMLAYIRPLALTELGLAEMLRRDLGEAGREQRVETNVSDSLITPLPDYVSIALFRLLQRAASTALASGQPGRLVVTLRSDHDQVTAQLERETPDSGDIQERLDAYISNPAVSKRLELLGGWADTETVDDRTVRLTMRVPILQQAA